jgi:DNA-binding phage protein
MKKKNIIMGTTLGVLLLGVTVPALASAHGMFGFGGSNATPAEQAARQIERFTSEANLLGVTVDEIKNYWAQGKGVREIAKEKGISEETLRAKMTELRNTQMKTHLATLVSQGVITQAQADTRLAFMEKTHAEGKGKFGKRGGHGRGMGF